VESILVFTVNKGLWLGLSRFHTFFLPWLFAFSVFWVELNLRQAATKRFGGFWFVKNRIVWMVLAEDMYQFALFGSRRLDAAFVCLMGRSMS
jgi:hypothetical protein